MRKMGTVFVKESILFYVSFDLKFEKNKFNSGYSSNHLPSQ